MTCETIGVDATGSREPITLWPGDSFFVETEVIDMGVGVTISSGSLVIYDQDGDDTGIVSSVTVASPTVTWGWAATATDDLDAAEDYTYRLRLTLSNGMVNTVYRGPLQVTSPTGENQ